MKDIVDFLFYLIMLLMSTLLNNHLAHWLRITMIFPSFLLPSFYVFFFDFKRRTLINRSQVFEYESLVKLLPNNINILWFKLFVFDELINSTNILGDYCHFDFVWEWPQYKVWDVENNPYAMIVLLVKIKKVKP